MPTNKVNNNIKLKSGGGLINDANGLSVAEKSSVNCSLVAGQDLLAGNSVIIASAAAMVESSTSGSSNNETFQANKLLAQTFFATGDKVSSVVLRATGNGLSGKQVTVSIRATSAGVPNGTDIEGKTVTATISSSPTDTTFTFASPVSIVPGNTYAMVAFGYSSFDGQGLIYGNSSSEYPRGSFYTSTNNGGSWSDVGRDLIFTCNMSLTAGSVYKTSAFLSNQFATNFIGIVENAYTKGDTASVVIDGAATMSGLTTGVTYYLSDTPGLLSTSAGTVSKKVGISLSTTKFLIKHDN